MSADGPDNFNFWPVYSDLAIVMILVLVLLSMGLMVLVTHLYALVPTTVLDAQREVRSAVLELNDNRIRVCDEQGSNQVIVLSSDVVFGVSKSATADMKLEGRQLVENVGAILAKEKARYQRIQIEGHASYESPDSRSSLPAGPEAETQYGMRNWHLSAERAGAVMQLFIDKGVPDYKISAAALGHYHPVVEDPCSPELNSEDYKRYNGTPEERQQNRRINILIMYGTEETPVE